MISLHVCFYRAAQPQEEPGAGVTTEPPVMGSQALPPAPGPAQWEVSQHPAVANQTQCHKQGLEQMAGCPWTAWRKRQQQDKGINVDWIPPSGPQLAEAQPENTASIVHPSVHNHHAEHTLSELMGLHGILLVERWYHRFYLCPL